LVSPARPLALLLSRVVPNPLALSLVCLPPPKGRRCKIAPNPAQGAASRFGRTKKKKKNRAAAKFDEIVKPTFHLEANVPGEKGEKENI
jgi:hypothetical protein